MDIKRYSYLLSIANKFYARHYQNILFDHKNNLDIHHGKISETFSPTKDAYSLLEEHLGSDITKEDFSVFKNIIYGIGIYKFHYNENLMEDFDHSVCKNLFDIVNNYLIHTNSKDNTFNIWTHFLQGYNTSPIVINDVLTTSQFIIEDIVFKQHNLIMNPTVKENENHGQIIDGFVVYSLINEYQNEILAFLERDFSNACYQIAYDFALKAKLNYSLSNFIFFEDNVTLTIPNLEVAKNVSVDMFFDDLNKIEQRDIKELYDLIEKYEKDIIECVNLKFNELYNKHKNSTDIRKNTKRKHGITLSAELFDIVNKKEP